MALAPNSPLFEKYLIFLLDEEGGKSKNPEDSAVRCAPWSGAYHTNKGVTYCTFQELAGQLGISPVNYDRFLALTDQEAAKFLYQYYLEVSGPNLPDILALSLTEAGWGSGPKRAVIHLQNALNNLGANPKLVVDGIIGPKTLAAVKSANLGKLYNAFWQERLRYIHYLISSPDYDQFATTWLNRISRFMKLFPAPGGWGLVVLILAATLGFAVYKARRKNQRSVSR